METDPLGTEQASSPSQGSLPGEAIQQQLETLALSASFAAAPRLARFLRFVVELTLAGRESEIKEYTVGVGVFDRPEGYDPRADPVVRVEARRLRTKLAEYYNSSGKADPIRIGLPKGSYVPTFRSIPCQDTSRAEATGVPQRKIGSRRLPLRLLQPRPPFAATPAVPLPQERPRRQAWIGLAGLALAALLAAGLNWPRPAPKLPTFHRLSLLPGTLESAHFGADGRTVYLGARIRGEKPEVFSLMPPAYSTLRPLGIPDSLLLSVSREDQLAILREPRRNYDAYQGTLAKVPSGGGGIRDIQEGVRTAAWDAEGRDLVRVVYDGNRVKIEYPSGVVLHTTEEGRMAKLVRVSRATGMAALVEINGGQTEIVMYEPGKPRRPLFAKASDASGLSLTGLAWRPDGKELWYSESHPGQTEFWALSLQGRRRLVWRGAGAWQLLDLAEGRVLAACHQTRRGILCQGPPGSEPVDLSLDDTTTAVDLTTDGKAVLVYGSTVDRDLTYLCRLDGTPPILLSSGIPRGLSPDGQWVTVHDPGRPDCLNLVPLGAGKPQTIPVAGLEVADSAYLLPDGRQVLVWGVKKGHGLQFFTVDREGRNLRPVTPEGVAVANGQLPLSPDGQALIGTTNGIGMKRECFRLDGRGPYPLPGLRPSESVLRWTPDGRSVYIYSRETLPVRIEKLDITTGKREPLSTFMPPDRAGLTVTSAALAPNGSVVAYNYQRVLSELFLIEGLN